MIIRKALMQDWESISILFDNYRKFYKRNADIIGAGIFIKDRLVNNDSAIIIAENEGKVIMGFVQLYPIFSSTRMKRLWLLNDLFIQPEFRNKGISIALINECKNLCRITNSCGMVLETAKDNIIGNSLYLKTGFIPDNDHHYYEWGNEVQ
ncbi:MAG: GNAT family N-acetyltransferase [Ferruginibacter sp.]|nr:GNAT family N-acetyltransferase [Ferruginibacter sp.]